MNLAELLIRAGRADARRPALAFGTAAVADYGRLARHAGGLAAGLRARLGLQIGDRVAVVMKNAPDYVTALFGVWWAGLAAVPVNAKLHAKEIDYILADSGARLCFVTRELAQSVAATAAVAEGRCRVIEAGGAEWRALLQSEPIAVHQVDAGELAWLFYTSGTTGRPKGAMLSHRSLLTMTACYFMDVDAIVPGDAILHAAPMSHGSGLYILPHVAAAALQVIPESGGFDPDEIFALLRAHRGVSFFAAPTMVHRLINAPRAGDADTSGLKTIVYGGGPMYLPILKSAMRLLGDKLAQIYGQGESPMTITALSKARHADTSQENYEARLASVGVAQSLVQVRVLDEQGMRADAGATGEIVVRGPSLMSGYWQQPDATAQTIRDGWLYTGDMGAMSADGFLTLKDRSKDVIISGGSNIYPREVEDVLLRHPAVKEAAVVGRPNEEWGEDVVAFVVCVPGGQVREGELDAHCSAQMARFKRPKHYRFLAELPKNNYGKVLKTALREMLRD